MPNDVQIKELITKALAARKWVYIPYSNYPVSAAILTSSGEIYTGVNIENASYSLTMCAERVAIFKAVSENHRSFETIVVVTKDGGSPCGACRQVLSEFGLSTIVIFADEHGKIIKETTVENLLPDAFGPSNLEVQV